MAGNHQLPRRGALSSVACPSPDLCVAGTTWGLVSSTNPTATAPAWRPNFLGTLVEGMSCPSTSFCLAIDGTDVVTSADPSGGGTAWRQTRLPIAAGYPGFLSSCPSATLCAVGGNTGRIFVSRDPTGGTSAWQSITLPTPPEPGSEDQSLSGIACPSDSLCVAVDPSGDVFTTTDPTGGASAWSKTSVGLRHPFAIACPSVALCVVINSDGDIATTTNPAGGSAARSVAHTGAILESLACGSPTLCVADGPSQMLTSTDPAGEAAAWRSTPAPAQSFSMTCAGNDLCVLPAGAHMMVASTDPTAGGPSYVRTLADNGPCGTTATVCVGQQLFVDDDNGKRVAAQSLPGATAPLSAPTQFGNSLTATWTDADQPQSARLR